MTKRQKIPQQFYKKKSFLKKLFLLKKKEMFVMIKGRKCPNNLIKKLINKIVKISALQNFNLFTS